MKVYWFLLLDTVRNTVDPFSKGDRTVVIGITSPESVSVVINEYCRKC